MSKNYIHAVLAASILGLSACGGDSGSSGNTEPLGSGSDVPCGLTNTCPNPSETDADGDGAMDDVDICPNTPPAVTVDARGCETQIASTDDDGDNVRNESDICPNTPANLVNSVDIDGCGTDEKKDTDGDGIVDDVDQCKFDKAITDINQDGCTDGIDTDGDGVSDGVDMCNDTLPDVQVNERGCNLIQDADQDMVPDNIDKCLDTPSRTPVDLQGCAINGDPNTDSDSDGVMDNLDACPATIAGKDVDEKGCSESERDLYYDDDADGVSNGRDLCENTQMGSANVDARGCADNQRDSDSDKVVDSLDQCPTTDRGVEVDEVGCSIENNDLDSDGVENNDDDCAGTPSNENADMNGCSESQKDGDRDGVMNDEDDCPTTPRSVVDVDANGCEIPESNIDNDDFIDTDDACVTTPNNGVNNLGGCPALDLLRIQAEFYKDSMDSDDINEGDVKLSRMDGVDIGGSPVQADLYAIGYTQINEWLSYKVGLRAGTYRIKARVGSGADMGGSYQVSFDGDQVGTDVTTDTQDWVTYETQTVGTVTIENEGVYDFRIDFLSGVNLDWFEFEKVVGMIDPVTPDFLYAINAGGPEHTTAEGITYVDGTAIGNGCVGTQVNNPIEGIADANDAILYQTVKSATRMEGCANDEALNYEIKVPNGTYEVVLKFSENFNGDDNERVVDIVIEDETKQQDFKIYDEADKTFYKAVDKTYIVEVTDEFLNIDITRNIENPVISALLIRNN